MPAANERTFEFCIFHTNDICDPARREACFCYPGFCCFSYGSNGLNYLSELYRIREVVCVQDFYP